MISYICDKCGERIIPWSVIEDAAFYGQADYIGVSVDAMSDDGYRHKVGNGDEFELCESCRLRLIEWITDDGSE